MSVDVAFDGPTGVVTVDRQEAVNALDLPTAVALRDALAAVAENSNIRCVVVTGGGDRAFIGGSDIKYMAVIRDDEARIFANLGHEIGRLLETMPKPTIAAINGFALGGGCEVALACDIRYASSNAKLGQPEVTFGLTPGFGGTQRLARTTTLGFAKELIFTGRHVSADEALWRGLVDGVHDPVLDKALETARLIALNGPEALAGAKALVNLALQGDHAANLAVEADWQAKVLVATEARQGLRAFVERQPSPFGNDKTQAHGHDLRVGGARSASVGASPPCRPSAPQRPLP